LGSESGEATQPWRHYRKPGTLNSKIEYSPDLSNEKNRATKSQLEKIEGTSGITDRLSIIEWETKINFRLKNKVESVFNGRFQKHAFY